MSAFEAAWSAWLVSNERATSRPDYFRAGWNAALDAAKAAMPGEAFGSIQRMKMGSEGIVGWNRCLSVMDERLDSLQAPSSSAPGEDAG